jgi:hypothetical protein
MPRRWKACRYATARDQGCAKASNSLRDAPQGLVSAGITLCAISRDEREKTLLRQIWTYSIRTRLANEINHLQAFWPPGYDFYQPKSNGCIDDMHRAERLMYVHSKFLPTRSVATEGRRSAAAQSFSFNRVSRGFFGYMQSNGAGCERSR